MEVHFCLGEPLITRYWGRKGPKHKERENTCSNWGPKEGFLEDMVREMGLQKSGILTHGMSLGAENGAWSGEDGVGLVWDHTRLVAWG